MEDTKPVRGHRICANGIISTKIYKPGSVSLGTQRVIFDHYLLQCAIGCGAEIRYGTEVTDICGCPVKELVWTAGAKPFPGSLVKGQSIGYSGQILAKTALLDDIFHYWYYEMGCRTKYFWAFPIGENLWNVGVWSRFPNKELKSDYERCLKEYFWGDIQGGGGGGGKKTGCPEVPFWGMWIREGRDIQTGQETSRGCVTPKTAAESLGLSSPRWSLQRVRIYGNKRSSATPHSAKRRQT